GVFVRRPFSEQHEAKTARVVIDDARRFSLFRREVEDDMVMSGVLRSLIVEIAGDLALSILFDAEGAGHAEMADQNRPAVDMRRPSSRAPKGEGRGKRRSGRRASTLSMRAPSITGCRPRRTVSTSGSSGMAA